MSENLKARAIDLYRRKKQELVRIQRQYMQTPKQELQLQVAEMSGFLRGVKKALDLIEVEQNSTFLPGME